MKAKDIVIAMVLGGVALGAAVVVSNASSWMAKKDAESTSEDVGIDPYLESVGPPAKAVVDETTYDFDVMERGTEGEHVFKVSNDGEGVLRIIKGKATCTCTKFMLKEDKDLERVELQPGESMDVTVAWKVKDGAEEHFKSVAPLNTNDPDNKYLALTIVGKVAYTMFVYPARTFIAPDVVGKEPVRISGIIGSRLLEDIELVSAVTDSEFVQVESQKLEFKEGRAEGVNGKCGYRIDALIQPDIPVGKFKAPIKVTLKAPDGTEYVEELSVVTTRTGPLKIVGKSFDARTMTLDFKGFNIADGVTAELSMFVSVPDDTDTYDFNVIKSTNEFVQMSIKRDTNFEGKSLQRYVVKFEIPPDTVTTPENKGRAEFIVETSHPEIKSIQFRAKYQAY
ncbi:hypothetical protein CA54_30640 [Symmachiella macrocystis]|uniref:DUF1573 domain-containing protein n=1 Tax=Symmachiella macrocystis TaxID=2527985 RepID=A0A5C6BS13_9PLAN|nr:DUF1573 domain-containing protein [Symmachiella macrocystis]TWU14221.1 hypothetical protein CA54_30640 [Symmachiella macrocystis]